MSSFEVLIRPIDDVLDHPNADRLSLVRILGYEAIAAKNEDGNHRFEKGEPICYIPEAALVPNDVLKATATGIPRKASACSRASLATASRLSVCAVSCRKGWS
jgi:hypothetical protein